MLTLEEIREGIKEHGSLRAFSRAVGIPKSTIGDRKRKLELDEIYTEKVLVNPIDIETKGEVRRFILSSAQDRNRY